MPRLDIKIPHDGLRDAVFATAKKIDMSNVIQHIVTALAGLCTHKVLAIVRRTMLRVFLIEFSVVPHVVRKILANKGVCHLPNIQLPVVH